MIVLYTMQRLVQRVCAQQRLDRTQYYHQRVQLGQEVLPNKLFLYRGILHVIGYLASISLCQSESYLLATFLIVVASSSHHQRGVSSPFGYFLAWIPSLILWTCMTTCQWMLSLSVVSSSILRTNSCGIVAQLSALSILCECAIDLDRVCLHLQPRVEKAYSMQKNDVDVEHKGILSERMDRSFVEHTV